MRRDWFNIGLFLVLGGGFLSLFRFAWMAPNTRYLTTGESLALYAISSGLSILVILGAFMVSKGYARFGYPCIFVPSVLFPLWMFLFVAFPHPFPETEPVVFVLYEAMAGTGYLVCSLIGGIIMLTTRSKGVTKP